MVIFMLGTNSLNNKVRHHAISPGAVSYSMIEFGVPKPCPVASIVHYAVSAVDQRKGCELKATTMCP